LKMLAARSGLRFAQTGSLMRPSPFMSMMMPRQAVTPLLAMAPRRGLYLDPLISDSILSNSSNNFLVLDTEGEDCSAPRLKFNYKGPSVSLLAGESLRAVE